MSASEVRTVRFALKLGSESRSVELHLRADSIDPAAWTMREDGTYTHPELLELAESWALDALELRLWTSDSTEPRLFALALPGEAASEIIKAARECTRDTTRRQLPPGHPCDDEELPEWAPDPDTWKH